MVDNSHQKQMRDRLLGKDSDPSKGRGSFDGHSLRPTSIAQQNNSIVRSFYSRGENVSGREMVHLNAKEMRALKSLHAVQDMTKRKPALASEGRGRDTKVGIVTKRISKALDQTIHHGNTKRNPRTGMKEYDPDGENGNWWNPLTWCNPKKTASNRAPLMERPAIEMQNIGPSKKQVRQAFQGHSSPDSSDSESPIQSSRNSMYPSPNRNLASDMNRQMNKPPAGIPQSQGIPESSAPDRGKQISRSIQIPQASSIPEAKQIERPVYPHTIPKFEKELYKKHNNNPAIQNIIEDVYKNNPVPPALNYRMPGTKQNEYRLGSDYPVQAGGSCYAHGIRNTDELLQQNFENAKDGHQGVNLGLVDHFNKGKTTPVSSRQDILDRDEFARLAKKYKPEQKAKDHRDERKQILKKANYIPQVGFDHDSMLDTMGYSGRKGHAGEETDLEKMPIEQLKEIANAGKKGIPVILGSSASSHNGFALTRNQAAAKSDIENFQNPAGHARAGVGVKYNVDPSVLEDRDAKIREMTDEYHKNSNGLSNSEKVNLQAELSNKLKKYLQGEPKSRGQVKHENRSNIIRQMKDLPPSDARDAMESVSLKNARNEELKKHQSDAYLYAIDSNEAQNPQKYSLSMKNTPNHLSNPNLNTWHNQLNSTAKSMQLHNPDKKGIGKQDYRNDFLIGGSGARFAYPTKIDRPASEGGPEDLRPRKDYAEAMQRRDIENQKNQKILSQGTEYHRQKRQRSQERERVAEEERIRENQERYARLHEQAYSLRKNHIRTE